MNLDKLYEKLNSLVALEIFSYGDSLKTVEQEFSGEFLYLNNVDNDIFSSEDEETKFNILRIFDVYFRNGKPLISDSKYDGLYKIYSSSFGDNVEPIMFEPSVDAWEKVEHIIPMGSLDKQTTVDEIEKWNKKEKIAGKEILISEKLDGISCLHENTMVELEDGSFKTIKEIVTNKIVCSVKSFNHDTNTVEFKKVTNFIERVNKNKKWLKVKMKNKSGDIVEVITTSDHLWFSKTNNEYKKLSKMKKGEKILYSFK